MNCEIVKACLEQVKWIDYATLLAAISAIIAAGSAFFSHRLSKSIYNEIKSDEVIIASNIQHPELSDYDHKQSVLYFSLLNKSHRKASITNLKVLDGSGKEIEIEWSDSIDKLGNIQNPTGLLGLKDSVLIFIRRNDGEKFYNAHIFIKHSFKSEELELIYHF